MKLKAAKAAFPYTVPILASFLFLGMTYGILMYSKGFSFLYPMFMSMTIFAGSIEFVAVNMLLGAFNPFEALMTTLILNARHLFYGIALLDKYKNTGIMKLYLIFGSCDETFSINYTADIPQDIDQKWFYFFVTVFNQIYWVTGATLGGLFGGMISINTKGLDFVMTAMFVTIFLSQFIKEKNHTSSYIGLIIPFLCLIIFKSSFMIPSMILILFILTIIGWKRGFKQ